MTSSSTQSAPIADYVIVLYSKYSPKCQTLIEIARKNPLGHIRFVCVDHTNVRQKLLKSNRFHVSTVPSILMVYPNNKIEKYENASIYDWVLAQYSQFQPIATTSTLAVPSPIVEPTIIEDSPISLQDNVVIEQAVIGNVFTSDANTQDSTHKQSASTGRRQSLQEQAILASQERDAVFQEYKKNAPTQLSEDLTQHQIPNQPIVPRGDRKRVGEIAAELQHQHSVGDGFKMGGGGVGNN